ncbi:hypothetical protein [Peribacillus loiseleuriae]|uniref:Uncharacterized protein n=1 Tax=Peribacillus loiseleuriae TaxID=1679170 RepID=A0A0K9GNX0_9BACI|nr:hypothetical protein [Peribacillus loiseleuriae]KMY48350.1 hypothetical protein AC625_01460 [Peribacillus loiseleuriae]
MTKVEKALFYEIVVCEIEHDGELEEDIFEFLNVQIWIEEDNLFNFFRSIPEEAVLEWLEMYTDSWNPNSDIYIRIIDQINNFEKSVTI